MRRAGQDACECDRCGYKENLDPESPNQAYWHDESRITGDGNLQRFLLCDGCHDKHKQRMLDVDREFALWLGGEN